MQRFIKSLFWAMLVICGCQESFGFSIAGPIGNGGDSWQSPVIGYGIGGDLNAPKNIGEEYRRNVPVQYYAFDQNFFDYFGASGAVAIDGTFAILNSLTNVDKYTKQLNEFPMESRHVNYQAQALGMYDLKSFTLGSMVEQLGLADPIRYNWTLHDRLPGAACPLTTTYLVAQRNFEVSPSSLTQVQYSPYVNNTLYTYQIFEHCSGANPLALSVPYAVDPLADTYSPVSGFIGGIMYVPYDFGTGTTLLLTYVPGVLSYGTYYTGLTRDDVAGLRYLITTNNVNFETPAPDALQIVTNLTQQALFPVSPNTNGVVVGSNSVPYGTSSLSALIAFSKTNGPGLLAGQYPGLQFTLLSNYFALVTVTNIVSYYTNFYGSPAGSPPVLVIKTNLTLGIQEFFAYTFDNIVTNLYKPTTTAKLQTIKVGPAAGSPAGSPSVTNITSKNVTVNIPFGEFYILPTNSPCGLDIVSTIYTFTNYTTNVLISTLNSSNTTVTTGSNVTSSAQTYAQIQIFPHIGHVYVIHPITCDTPPVTGLYRGISRMSFVRADYDSLIGQFWRPVTNDYNMTTITNSRATSIRLRRIVTTPDYLFSAEDLTSGPNDSIINNPVGVRNLNFDEANVLPNLAGPGTIVSPTQISYNKAGPMYANAGFDVLDGTPYFNQTPGGDLDNVFYGLYYVWASFDGSTNSPVVYPNGTSIEDLQNQLLVQINPQTLPEGDPGIYYDLDPLNPPGKFTITGGGFTAPFAWTEDSGVLAGIGLTLSADGTLTGFPTQSGTFDFTLKMTDVNGRSITWPYSITIR